MFLSFDLVNGSPSAAVKLLIGANDHCKSVTASFAPERVRKLSIVVPHTVILMDFDGQHVVAA
jgi:hypothetical protein